MGKSVQFRQTLSEIACICVGCVLYALSVVWFLDPAHIIPGSVTGIAVVAKALFGIRIGVLNLVINVPLMLVAIFFLGKKLLVYTALTVFLNSLLMDWWAVLPPLTDDMLLASIFGGVLMGIGLGMILKGGASTGGTTVVARLVGLRYPNMPIGTILLVGDFIIITMGSFLLKDWDLFLYSVLDLYVCIVVIDKVVYGFDTKVAAVVYTQTTQEVQSSLKASLPCRTMALSGGSGLVCYCKRSHVSKLQRAVEKADPSAECKVTLLDYSFGGSSEKE